jgi:NAD(P)-dependent dehydrogenase (short-subunit alcohol dehydrogenase family)
MPSLSEMKASNALIPKYLPTSFTAIFVGGTKGIGAYCLLALLRHHPTTTATIYVLARSPTPVIDQARTLAPNATITFIKCDASLLKDVDRVCASLQQKVKTINLLYMSQGTLDFHATTPENLPTMAALAYYSRIRFAQNLLPQLRAATGLKRVVNVLCGGKEGPLDVNDLHLQNQGGGMPKISAMRGHSASMLTLAMERVSKEAGGEVGFVHSFPGHVLTGIADTMTGVMGMVMRLAVRFVMPLYAMGGEECGERQVFAATSGIFDGRGGEGGVVVEGVDRAIGTDGEVGSGSYAVDENNGVVATTVPVLEKIRESGDAEKLWDITKSNMDKALAS